MDVTLFGACSHLIIMLWKMDPHAEGGVRILIMETSIKAIEMCRVLEKARLILDVTMDYWKKTEGMDIANLLSSKMYSFQPSL
jgi:hypothetical protein